MKIGIAPRGAEPLFTVLRMKTGIVASLVSSGHPPSFLPHDDTTRNGWHRSGIPSRRLELTLCFLRHQPGRRTATEKRFLRREGHRRNVAAFSDGWCSRAANCYPARSRAPELLSGTALLHGHSTFAPGLLLRPRSSTTPSPSLCSFFVCRNSTSFQSVASLACLF